MEHSPSHYKSCLGFYFCATFDKVPRVSQSFNRRHYDALQPAHMNAFCQDLVQWQCYDQNFLHFLQTFRPEMYEKYFLSFPQKIYKLRQLSLAQFVYFLREVTKTPIHQFCQIAKCQMDFFDISNCEFYHSKNTLPSKNIQTETN